MRRLPPLSKFINPDDMPDLYAVTGVGTCMEPEVPDGTCCVFDKREDPKPGDIVGVIFTPEAAARRQQPGMIKRLVMSPPPAGFEGVFIVEQVNPPRDYTLETRDVLAIHKFVGTAIRGEEGKAYFAMPKREAA